MMEDITPLADTPQLFDDPELNQLFTDTMAVVISELRAEWKRDIVERDSKIAKLEGKVEALLSLLGQKSGKSSRPGSLLERNTPPWWPRLAEVKRERDEFRAALAELRAAVTVRWEAEARLPACTASGRSSARKGPREIRPCDCNDREFPNVYCDVEVNGNPEWAAQNTCHSLFWSLAEQVPSKVARPLQDEEFL